MKNNKEIQMRYNQPQKIIIWGAGKKTRDFLAYYDFFNDVIEIVAITDSDIKRWGENFEGYEIISPLEASRLQFERIIIPSEQYYKEISNKIIFDLKIDESYIENIYYITKCKLNARYKFQSDKKNILSYIKNNPLDVFNYKFIEKYNDIIPEIGYDSVANLYYVVHKTYRMYMAKRLDTKEKVINYYKSLCIEQDKNSPHLYLQGDFNVKLGDVVVDVGAAEGFFSLEIIERAKKIYLLESDKEWIKALQYTFKNYLNKVVMINKFVSDYTAYNSVRLDDLNMENVNFIKMDIEGCEYAAMMGAKELINRSSHIRCALCTYHNDNDEVALESLAKNLKLKVSFTEGYMFFPYSIQQIFIMPTLRKGIIRCEK